MGATTYPGASFTEAAASALRAYTVLAKAAGVPDEDNVAWFALSDGENESICQALWRSYGRGRSRETTLKVVHEQSGPGDVCVPDRVWFAARPDPDQMTDEARRWRREVAAFREQYPMLVRDLGPDQMGRLVKVPGAFRRARYIGRLPHGKGTCQVFDVPGQGRRRLARGVERAQRCAVVGSHGVTS